ncbi:MAG: hypothetical protein Q7T98_02410 [Polaromonas sp.]|nr:hypothetical protein [Polaromonas sp.]
MVKTLLASSLVLLSALPALALAQAAPASAPSTAAPVNPAAASSPAPPEYRSAFEGYQPYTDEKTLSWKEANDRVGSIGGWRVYAKEAQEPSAPGASAKPDPHAGHSKQ